MTGVDDRDPLVPLTKSSPNGSRRYFWSALSRTGTRCPVAVTVRP